MADREKVIEHITDCVKIADRQINHNWVFVRVEILKDAIALLKEQEPVEPKKNDVDFAGLRTWDWACPECNCILIYRANYCSCCGQAVKWE